MHRHRSRVSRSAALVCVLAGGFAASAAAQATPAAKPKRAAEQPAPAAASDPSSSATPEPASAEGDALAQAQTGHHPDSREFGPNSVVTGGVTPPGNIDQTPNVPGPPEPEQAPPTEEVPADQPASSQDLQFVQEDVAGVRTDLENFKFQWQRERDLHTAITTRFLRITGVVQARFGWQDQIVHGPRINNRKTTFDIPTATLAFSGSLYRDYEEGRNLSYVLRFGVSQQTNSNNAFLNLLDANIAYDVLPTVNPESSRLSITVGQQLLPFGLEVPATEELKPVIRNAQFTTTLNLARRDLGLIVRGELFPYVDYGYNYRVPILSYAVGVINGAGPNTLDDNNWKDVIGRVAFTLPSDYNSWLRQLTIGGSVVWGKQNLYLGQTAMPPLAKVGQGDKERYGVDFYYNHWPIGITYEFIEAKDEIATGATPDAAVRLNSWSQSHTATLFWSWGEQFVAGFRNQARFDDWWPKTYQPFIRYDRWRADAKRPDGFTEIYTFGFNLFIAETTKMQLNYNLKNSSVQSTVMGQTAVETTWNHEILAQAQFGF